VSPSWMEGLSALEMTLIIGISTLFSLFVWLLKRFIKSYDDNTRTLVAINATMQIMDKKLDAATEIDREILMELARVNLYRAG